MPIKLPNGKIARTIAEQVYKNMQDIAFLMNKKDFQILVVDELPEEGSENTLYLVPSDDPEQDNVYTEYIWTGTAFEMVGTTAIDISNMVTTDTNQNIIGEKTFEGRVDFYEEIVLSVDAAFTGDILPKVTNNDNIGSATNGWKDYYMEGTLYLKNGDGYSNRLWRISDSQYGTIDIKTSNDNGANWNNRYSLQTGAFCPTVASTIDLGTNNAGQRWKDFYFSGSIKQTNYNINWNNGVEIKNSSSATLFYVGSDKSIWFYGKLTPSGNPDIGDSAHTVKDLYVSGHLKDGLGNDATMEELVAIGKALTGTLQPNTVTLADGDTLTDAATIQIMFLHLPIKVNGLMFYFICEANNKYYYYSYAIDASNNYTAKRLFIDKSTYLVGYHTI